MKNIIRVFTIAIIIAFAGCEVYEPVPVNPGFTTSLERAGTQKAFVNIPITVIPTGTGEFLTLYDGTPSVGGQPSHIYGEEGAVGQYIGNVDSVQVKYSKAGTYTMTLVSSSTGNYGKTFETKTSSKEITVFDNRNNFTSFSINLGERIEGTIRNDSVIFNVLTGTDVTNIKSSFTLNSDLAKVYVNGVEQVSCQTSQDFTIPVEYTVKSAYGNEHKYIVKFNVMAASAEKELLKYNLAAYDPTNGYIGSYGEVGVIDQNMKTVTITINTNTNTTTNSVWLQMESSKFSKIYIVYNNQDILYNAASTQRYRLNLCKTIKVVAQDGSFEIYTVTFN